MKTILAIILFGLASKAYAGSPLKRPGELPVPPEAEVTSDEEMVRVQEEATQNRSLCSHIPELFSR
jgi:hypothetical protein